MRGLDGEPSAGAREKLALLRKQLRLGLAFELIASSGRDMHANRILGSGSMGGTLEMIFARRWANLPTRDRTAQN